MGVQFILFMGIEVGVGVLLARRLGLWKRLRAAPLSRSLLLGSHIVSGAITALILLAIIYAAAIGIFHVRIEGSVAGFVGVAIAFALLTSSFGLLIAAIGKTPEATRGLAIFATLVMVMLGGAWVPSFIFPPWLQTASLAVPTRWAVDGLDAMTWRGLGFDAAVAPIAVLLGFSVAVRGDRDLALRLGRAARLRAAPHRASRLGYNEGARPMQLTTFAFLEPVEAEQLALFRAALPAVEFLHPQAIGLPAGIERAEAAAISWHGPPVDDVLAAAARLRWLHQRGAGADRILTPRLVASDVVLTNGSGNHAINIAEHVLAMMLSFARQLPALVRSQLERRWEPPRTASLFELSGQTLAVIGAGALGCAVAERAAAFGMRVVGVRRTPSGPLPPGFAACVRTTRSTTPSARPITSSLTLPLTARTRGLFGAERFAAMKRGAHLYNVGRGAIVDHDALLASLRSGRIAGAGLDVTEPEPLPADSPLWSEPGVLDHRPFVRPDAALVRALSRPADREHAPLRAGRGAAERRRQA